MWNAVYCHKVMTDNYIRKQFCRFLKSVHSRPQICDPFGQRHGSRALAGSENRKSANHGLPAFCAASEIWNNNGYHRLQKWAAIALARYPGPYQSMPELSIRGAGQKDRSSGDENEKCQHLIAVMAKCSNWKGKRHFKEKLYKFN